MIQSSICRRRLRIVLSGTALLLAGICLFPAVSGSADKYWTGGTGVWENNGNWDPAGAPQNADSVFITSFDGIGRTVTYSVLPASPTILNLLRVDAVNGGTSSLAQTAAPFSSHTEVVGYQGTGAFNQ